MNHAICDKTHAISTGEKAHHKKHLLVGRFWPDGAPGAFERNTVNRYKPNAQWSSVRVVAIGRFAQDNTQTHTDQGNDWHRRPASSHRSVWSYDTNNIKASITSTNYSY